MNSSLPASRKSGILMWCALGLLAIGCVVLVVVLASRRSPEVSNPEPKPVLVSTMKARLQPVADTLVLPGRLEPSADLDLAADKAGTVAEVLVEKGAIVDAGQTLMRIDSRLWQSILDRAAIEKRESEKEFIRGQELRGTGALSDRDFEALQSRRDMAVVACTEAGVHVSQCEVRSPIRGVVVERNVDRGERVGEGERVFKVIAIDPVKVVLDVPEKAVSFLRAGAPLAFRLPVVSGQVLTGAVVFVSSLGDRQGNSFRVEGQVANPDGRLKPGMIAEVDVSRDAGRQAVVVPLSALVPRRGEHIVNVVIDGRAVARVVRVESFIGQSAVVTDGLEPGEEIVLDGTRALVSGCRVAVETAGAEAP